MSSPLTGAGALIIIPTYNETENLPSLIPAIHEHLPEAHVLVVDDNSPDGTGPLADTLAAADERIHVLHREGKAGLGTAYIAGFRWGLARDYQFLFEMDADFSHQPRYLPDLLRAAQDHDMVIGSRYVPGGGTEDWGVMRKLMSRGGSLYARTILGVSIRDLTGGFKCFRREALEAIDLDGIRSKGFGFQVEMNYKVSRQGLRVAEVPIVFPDRSRGTSKMNRRIFFEALVNVWKIRLGIG